MRRDHAAATWPRPAGADPMPAGEIAAGRVVALPDLAVIAIAVACGLAIGTGVPIVVTLASGAALLLLTTGVAAFDRSDRVLLALVWIATAVFFGVTAQRTVDEFAREPVSSLHLIRAAVAIGAILVALSIRGTRSMERVGAEAWLYLYLLFALASTWWSVDPRSTLGAALQLTLGFALVTTLASLRDYDIEAILRDVAVFSTVILAATLVAFVVSPGSVLEQADPSTSILRLRASVITLAPNFLGLLCATTFLLMVARTTPRWMSGAWARTGIAIASLAGILLSRTRGSLIELAVGLVVLAFTSRRIRSRIAIVGPFLTALLVLTLVVSSTAILTYLERGQSREAVTSLTGRTNKWSAGVAQWRENPVVGDGYYAAHRVGPVLELLRREANNLDNMWIESLLDTGVIGTILLGIFVAVGSIRMWTRRAPPVARALGAMLLVASFVNPSLEQVNYAMVVFGLLLIASIRLPRPAPQPR